MKLTCVTATFNAIKSGNRESLTRCVESVAKLKTEHEHLIYDGASTDGTVELLRDLEAKTPGLKVVSEPDTGIYNALNKGVRDAKGEWFYVLGCDDYIFSPLIMDSIVSTARNESLIVSPVKRFGQVYQFHKKDDLKWIFIHHAYCHQGVISRTEKVRSYGGFDERYKISADGDLCLKFHLAGERIRYAFDEFAYFAPGGTCESGDGRVERENISFISQRLRLRRRDEEYFRRHKFHWIMPMLRYCVHKDEALRRGARFMIVRCIQWYVHIVKAHLLKIGFVNYISRAVKGRKR